jgi:hypothetical protein
MVAADRTQAVDEFGLDQLAQFAGVVGAAAQRLRGERDRRAVGFDAQIEFGADVDAHAILGDQRIRAAAGDLEPQRLQIDRGGRNGKPEARSSRRRGRLSGRRGRCGHRPRHAVERR